MSKRLTTRRQESYGTLIADSEDFRLWAEGKMCCTVEAEVSHKDSGHAVSMAILSIEYRFVIGDSRLHFQALREPINPRTPFRACYRTGSWDTGGHLTDLICVFVPPERFAFYDPEIVIHGSPTTPQESLYEYAFPR